MSPYLRNILFYITLRLLVLAMVGVVLITIVEAF